MTDTEDLPGTSNAQVFLNTSDIEGQRDTKDLPNEQILKQVRLLVIIVHKNNVYRKINGEKNNCRKNNLQKEIICKNIKRLCCFSSHY